MYRQYEHLVPDHLSWETLCLTVSKVMLDKMTLAHNPLIPASSSHGNWDKASVSIVYTVQYRFRKFPIPIQIYFLLPAKEIQRPALFLLSSHLAPPHPRPFLLSACKGNTERRMTKKEVGSQIRRQEYQCGAFSNIFPQRFCPTSDLRRNF